METESDSKDTEERRPGVWEKLKKFFGSVKAEAEEEIPAEESRMNSRCISITVPGRWYARPVSSPTEEWMEVTETPAKIALRPEEVYRLDVHDYATDGQLGGLAQRHLRGLPGLYSVRLTKCIWITDKGLVHLHGLTDLQELDLSGCKRITDEGVAALKRSLPDCRIVTHRRIPD